MRDREVARSSFYAWLAAAPVRAVRAGADAALAERIRKVHEADTRPGRPADHRRAQRRRRPGCPGQPQAGRAGDAPATASPGCGYAAAYAPRSRSRPTRTCPICWAATSPPPAPNQRYVGDITYLPIADGSNLYLATVIDCYSRRLAGWAVAEHMRTDLVVDALSPLPATRGARWPGRSSTPITARQYTSKAFARLCAPSWASPSRWARSAPAPTTRWPSRSTPRSNARPCTMGRLARPGDVSPRGVPVGDPLQHPPPSLLVRPAVPDQLRAAAAGHRDGGLHRPVGPRRERDRVPHAARPSESPGRGGRPPWQR